MKRDYTDGVQDSVEFFTGIEIENTKFKGMKTLFVVGCQSPDKITQFATEAKADHIFLGANHSWVQYSPHQFWTIRQLLKLGYKISVDTTYETAIKLAHELAEYNTVMTNICIIAQLPVVGIEKLLGIDAYIKFDDADFKYSNSGVWVAPVEYYLNPANKTSWDEYGKDEVLK